MREQKKNQNLSFTPLFTMSAPFLKGMARTINIFNSLDHYNYSASDDEADAKALYSDWKNVGNELINAISNYERSRTTT